MISITAILRAREGEGEALLAALREVAAHVRAAEPGTRGFFVSRDLDDPALFTTYERFADRAAMEAHNGSPAVARFFELAGPLLEGPVTLLQCEEREAVQP
ncbi:putative quinol monooxygenase [Pseudoroseomonas cervicalis]|uniref:Antibiotic biosynthesis monooxygenase n=1 Tax=Pseudoroseomonas cervicalis ATCC 49957 TaxID=525371 RepID=D5RSZ9_9PROT|nr:putative quinol monooxygenase [Pseudoroseomonas cervicalis]EFH09567.1 antibiotic biosynthesis monooxygenase [Pseudoroseomonas cervicalis ATCC 49957]